MMIKKRSLCIGVVIFFGCANLDEIDQGLTEKTSTAVYPVDPSHHADRADTDVMSPDNRTAELTNAVAYARYAVALSTPSILETVSPVDIARQMAKEAFNRIDFDEVKALSLVTASERSYEQYMTVMSESARNLSIDQLPRMGKQIIDGRAKLDTCVEHGYQPSTCCQSLLWFEGFRNEFAMNGGYIERTNHELEHRLEDARTQGSIHPFRQSGIRAWLSYCGDILSHAPSSLQQFKQAYGDYHTDAQWHREFHPISPAKQSGRRIFRRALWDGTQVSVAESTRDDCSVLETEVIVKPPQEAARFWVFDHHDERVNHAYFPTRRPGRDSIKFAPNTCMGCHYTFDTRQFDVVTPSFEALHLKLFDSSEGSVWRDHTHCAHDEDVLVLHNVETTAI